MSGWDSRAPSELQMGNGSMLVTFDRMGEIEQIFAPHIDALTSRLGVYRNSVLLYRSEGGTPERLSLHDGAFEVRLRFGFGTQILQAEYHHRSLPLRLGRRIALHPTEPLMLDAWQASWEGQDERRVGLLHQSAPWMGLTTAAHCSLFHPTLGGLVHHRGRRWIGVIPRKRPAWARVGHLSSDERTRLWDGAVVVPWIDSRELDGFNRRGAPTGWDHVVQGMATTGALAVADEDGIEFLISCAQSEEHLVREIEQNRLIESDRFIQMVEGMSARRLAPAESTLVRIRNPRVRALAERSIDVLHALQDAESGALMAAAEVDPHSRVSGGYGYSWPRDGAYLASALGAFGFRDRVEKYFGFLQTTQDPSGAWWQRYLSSGQAGPSWGRIQIDEPATVISAAFRHFRRTQDLFWLEKFWPTLKKGLSFLEAFHGPDHPMGQPSHDLWEERMGIHAYSLGAVACAFLSAAEMAHELADDELATRYLEQGRRISSLISERFVTSQGPPKRSLIGNQWDEIPDISMLGLIAPFGIFKKRDVAATRILESTRTLWSEPVGGVLRYRGDHYRGGNPWVLTTLWLAAVELSLGNYTKAQNLFRWVLEKTTPQGMMAEQIHRESGLPCWVIPLGWSHAMYLLFVEEVLQRGAEKEIWENY